MQLPNTLPAPCHRFAAHTDDPVDCSQSGTTNQPCYTDNGTPGLCRDGSCCE